MSFRSTLMLGMSAVVVALLLGMVAAIVTVLDREARAGVEADLLQARTTFESLWELRGAQRASQTAVVAEEPRLKAVVGTADITPETIVGVAQDLNRGVEADIFLITDRDGTLLADVQHPDEHGGSIVELPGVAAALEDGAGSAVWTDDEGVYDVHVAQIRFGATPFGLLVLGWRLDEGWVRTVAAQTSTEVLLERDGTVVASTLESLPAAAAVPSALSGDATAPVDVAVGGTTYLRTTNVGQEQIARDDVRHQLLSSLDRALEPSRRLKRAVVFVAAAALVLAVILALGLARRLGSPLAGLVQFTRRVAGGDLDARAPRAGVREMQTLADAMNTMVGELDRSRQELATKERLEREMEIASQLQTSMLPRELAAPELQIAAKTRAADEVGGDYYDVRPREGGGTWIGVGDVAGHGLPAGIVMMMVQTAISAVIESNPSATPAEVLARVNRIVYDNVHHRLGGDEHVTLCLLLHEGGGRFLHAGAHEDMLVWRASTKKFEWHRTHGTWMGVRARIGDALEDQVLTLATGDVLILVTDGIFEARDAQGEMFGLPRIEQTIGRCDPAADDVAVLVDALVGEVEKFASEHDDDLTVLVLRYTGEAVDARPG